MVLNAVDQKVVDDVAKYGWHCLHVGAGDGEPNFSYSVGWLESINSAEAIIFGLPLQLQQAMLWELFRQIRSGFTLADGLRVSDLIEGQDCIVRSVHGSRIVDYFGFALWYNRLRGGSQPLEAFQVFWPGRVQGLFPWESGCDPAVRNLQPLLFLPKDAP